MLATNRLFHRNEHDDDEDVTVQVSDANCHLGHLLLEGDWAELTNYLSTDEGQRDVEAKNDPIGLSKLSANAQDKHATIPSSKDTAFFAALFVRAPFDVIGKIYTLAPAQVVHPEDLLYVLSVIPSEEEVRAAEVSKRVPCRTRSWTADEYYRILDLLLQSFITARASGTGLMQFWPEWMLGESDLLLTPLAVAAYNPDVPAAIVHTICALNPQAMEKRCRFFGHSAIPLIVAAASPLPPELSAKYSDAKRLRWEKVMLLTLHKAFYHGYYDEQRQKLKEAVASGNHDVDHPLIAPEIPDASIGQIKNACQEAIEFNEWELVREFLRRNSAAELESVREALTKHDEKATMEEGRKEHAKSQARARQDWLHNNMGLVMYPVNAVLDLVSAVAPAALLQKDEPGPIVGPMS